VAGRPLRADLRNRGLVSLTVIYATIFGIGHFGDAAVPLAERVRGAQVVMVMVTFFTLVLVALFAQRRENEAQLAKKRVPLSLDYTRYRPGCGARVT
jgi:hypothetical protein